MILICDNCKKEFERKKSDNNKNHFCSLKCYRDWLKINYRQFPSTSGSCNPRYLHDIDHNIVCEWCKKQFVANAWKIKNGVRFCSNKCRRDWYSKVWSQTEEWSNNRREWAVSMLENGSISRTLSAPQVIVNNLLNELDIPYDNEKSYNTCVVDNYLKDNNLIIEVMGEYFHCDIRKYKIIPYKNQVNRIRMDKIKHSLLSNNYKIEVLYLWERDIYDNLEMCKHLIIEYINKNGILENYHSINYNLLNNNLFLNNSIIIPYMNWDIVDLNKVIKYSTKEKMSKKQIDKWIKFSCESCGIEKEELITHYNKKEHHFCSQECSKIFRKENDWHRRLPPSTNLNK